MRLRILLAALVILLVTLACGGAGAPTRRPLNLYPTETPNATQTPIYLEVEVPVTQMVERTTVVEVTPTPDTGLLCVSAVEAVYLRPSPSDDNYPITSVSNGTEVYDLGGRDGAWWFVRIEDKQGWIYSDYLGVCR